MSDREDEEEVDQPEAGRKNLSEKEIIDALLSTSSVALRNMVPSGPLKSESIIKVANWILTSNAKKRSTTIINQRLKWLTAVVQYGIVDSLTELQQLFNPFIQLIYISKYQATVCHLLYMIATPKIYKFQVERITKNANVVGLTKPLAGLLSRIKSLRPDLVPQTIPHQSSAVSFPKAPIALRKGLYELSERIKENNELPNAAVHLTENGSKPVTKKMRLDIIPRVEHINLKSSFEVDFRKLVLLTQFQKFDDLVSKITTVELPNHVGSLLSKREYHYVLALNYTPYMEALLSQWLYLTLCHEFIERPQLVGREGKVLLLTRIIEFQQSTGRRLMAVYDFLSEYLEKWDGVQYNDQVFQLLAATPFLPYTDLYDNFLRVLEDQFHFSPASHRLKIVTTCRLLIYNLLLQKFGPPEHARKLFQESSPSIDVTQLVEGVYVISEVIRFTERLLNMALTSSTGLSFVFHSLYFYSWLIDVESEFQLPFRTFCQPITVYFSLSSPAPASVALLCKLLCKYNLGREQLMSMSVLPELQEFQQDAQENASMLNRYCRDTSSCLISQKAYSAGSQSLLSNVPMKIRKQLATLGAYNAAFDLKRHPAFTGVARQWMRSKAADKSLGSAVAKPLQVFEEIDADPDGYLQFLFGYFPTLREYIQQCYQS